MFDDRIKETCVSAIIARHARDVRQFEKQIEVAVNVHKDREHDLTVERDMVISTASMFSQALVKMERNENELIIPDDIEDRLFVGARIWEARKWIELAVKKGWD